MKKKKSCGHFVILCLVWYITGFNESMLESGLQQTLKRSITLRVHIDNRFNVFFFLEYRREDEATASTKLG